MRDYIDIIESSMMNTSSNKPYIRAHKSGEDVVWIDMMFVPPDQRGKGLGKQYYEEWESDLPYTVKLVRIMAADTGSGLSNGFWEKMGFEYQYYGTDLPYEVSQYMWKGVNGHPTPPSINVDENSD